MKKPDISSWSYDDNLECLLVFANLVDEITFNYTTDSYKAPALHVMSLMSELLQTIENINKGVIREQALGSVIGELKWSIERDDVFLDIVASKKLRGVISIINSGSSTEDMKHATEMIVRSISNDEYLKGIKEKISDVIKNTRQKKQLEKLTRTLITHLRFMGYSEDFIYYKNREFFFKPTSFINAVSKIDEFLSFFTGNSKTYKVIHIVNNIVAQIKNAIVTDGGDVGDDFNIGINNNRVKKFKHKLNNNWKFVTTKVDAKDEYAARIAAEDRISALSNIFSFYHHKNTLTFHDVCMVVDIANPADFVKIKKPTPNIVRCKDLKPFSASRLFIQAANHVSMEPDSIIRIQKSLKLHQAALTADTLENQFVNLFTALEILIPKQVDSGKDRIIQIYDTLIPYLCLGYFNKLINSVVVTLRQWNVSMLNHIEQTVKEGTSTSEKVCAYMLLQKYDQDLDNVVYKAITADKFMLLRHRMFRLHKMMEKPSELQKYLKHHEQKLKWHIDRIYRTRNLIVHSGVSPYYLETLLENIHFYYDILITRLIHDNLKRGFQKLEYSYLMYEVEYKEYQEKLSRLQSKGDSIDENNFLDAVLLQS